MGRWEPSLKSEGKLIHLLAFHNTLCNALPGPFLPVHQIREKNKGCKEPWSTSKLQKELEGQLQPSLKLKTIHSHISDYRLGPGADLNTVSWDRNHWVKVH